MATKIMLTTRTTGKANCFQAPLAVFLFIINIPIVLLSLDQHINGGNTKNKIAG